jgi:tetratricopeptide (TPR) repeat protein
MFGFFPTSRSPNTFYRDHARISGVFLMLRKWMTFLVVALVGFSVLTGSGFCSLSWAAEETSNDASKEAANNTSSNTANDASKEAANNTAKDAASEATSETPKETAKDTANNEAQKYHAALQKRPEPGYLFDRFYNAWLDQGTAESLQEFLQKQVEQSDTTANRLLLAFFDSKQNNDVAAIEEFGKALKNEPANAAAWFYKAQAESRVLDFETAVADLKHARELNPNAKLSVLIERQLGTMLLRNHKTDEALEVWQALLKANPADEELCEDVVELHIEEGLFKEAATLQESLIAKTKDPYTAVMRRLRLGDIHHRAGQRQKAIDVYAATLAESGQDTWLEREILAQIEQIFRVEDDLAGLKKEYATLLETYPKRIGLQRRRCRLLADLGEPDEAVKGYRAILELTPGNREYREEYVDMLCRVGKQDLAVKELKVLCEQNPKDAELQVRLAKTLQEAKQSDEAVEAVKQYLQIAEQNEYAYLRAARLVESFGDKERAAEFYRTMVEKFSDSPSAQEAYAAFLYANNKKEDAQAIWKTQMQTADVAHALGIARALESRGEDAAVMELLKSREKDFGADPLFLGQLVNTSLRLKQFEQAIPWAKRRVELSQNATDLENAVSQIVTACQQCDKVHVLIDELKQSSDRPIALTCLLAELLESAGESKEADELLRGPTEKGDLLAVGEQIRLFTLRGEWANAADATRRLFELSGGRQSQYVRKLVELYERDSRLDEALKWVETWKRLSTGATTPWLTEVRLLKLQGKENDSLATLQKAIQRFEEDEELKVQLAQAFQESGKNTDAERVYWHLYEKSSDVESKLRWASELAKLAQQDGSISRLAESFQQRSRNNRESIVPLLALAEVYRVADDYEKRRQSLLAATKLKPDDLQLLAQIARLEEMEGDWKSAMATLEQAAKLDKTNRTKLQIAKLHLEYGDRDVGFAMLRDAIGERIADPRALERMVDSLCSMKEWEQAAELLAARISEHPRDYRLHYLLGVCYEESGHMPEAIEQFVSLLDNQEELPGTKPNTSQNNYGMGPFLDLLRHLLPAEAVEWFRLEGYQTTAYSYLMNNQGGMTVPSPIMGATSSTISLPPTVDDVQPFAMVHLLLKSNGLEDSQKAALITNMKMHGVRDPKLLLKLGINMENGMSATEEALAEDPDNEVLLALFVFSGFQTPRADKADDLVRAFKKFQGNHPELAMMAAVQAASISSDHAAILDEAITAMAKVDRPSPFIIMAMAQALGAQLGMPQSGESALSAEQREKMVRQLIDWYPKISQGNASIDPWIFLCVSGAVRANGTPDAYFSLLDDEVARWRKSSGKQNNSNQVMFIGQNGNASFLEMMKFPPQELTDFSPTVMEILASADSSISPMVNSMPQPIWEAEVIESTIQKVKDPTLRVLLAHRYDLPKIVESTLKEMLAKKPPQLDAYLLAAGKAGVDTHYGEAVELLENARNLSMKEAMRRRVDAAIVAAVLAAKGESKSDDDLLKSGRDASLRLRRQRLDQKQREQLVSAFSDLGQEEEAKKLEKQISGIVSTIPASGVFINPAVTTPTDRIDKLMELGKRDAAVKQFVAEVKTLQQQMLANPGNAQYCRSQAKELKKRIAGYDMTEDVIKQFAPGESNNATRLNEIAFVYEVFDKEQEAQKLYERILEQHPKDDTARARLLMILLKSEKNMPAFDEHFPKLSDSGCNMMAQMLSSQVDDNESGWNERFRFMEIAIRLLAKEKDRPHIDVDWANSLVQSFGNQQFNNASQKWLPSLYQYPNDNDSMDLDDASVLERREKLHRDLCLQMMEFPELGRWGFQRLLAAAEARGDVLQKTPKKEETTPVDSKPTDSKATDLKADSKTDSKNDSKSEAKSDRSKAVSAPRDTEEQFLQYAEKILLAELDQRKSQRGQSGFMLATYFGSDSNDVRHRSPEEYLVVHAWRSNDWSRIDQEWLPKTKEGVGRQKLKNLERMVKLYRCPSEEFLAVAKEVIKESATPTMPMSMNLGMDGLSVVIDIWADRLLTVDIQPLVMDAMRRNANGISQGNVEFPVRYLVALVSQGKTEQVKSILEEFAVLCLGPVEKRAEFVKKHYQPQSINSGTPNEKIHWYLEFLGRLAQKESLYFIVLSQAESLPEALLDGNLENQLQSNRSEFSSGKAFEFLEASPWLADLEQFHVLPIGSKVEQWPFTRFLSFLPATLAPSHMFSVHIASASATQEEKCRDFWKKLEEKQQVSPTFGRGLVLAARPQKDEKTGLLEFLEKHFEEIQKLPAKEQMNLSLMVKVVVCSELRNAPTDKMNSQKIVQWLNQHSSERATEFLERFEKAKRLEDLNASMTNPWEVGEYLDSLVCNVIDVNHDSQTAQKIFWRVVALCEDAEKRGIFNSYNNSRTPTNEILQAMLQRHQSDISPTMMVFLIDLLNSREGAELSLSMNEWMFNNGVQSLFQKAGPESSPSQEKMEKLYEQLGEALGDLPDTLLLPSFYSMISCHFEDKSKLQSLCDWTKEEMQHGKYPVLAADLYACIRMLQENRIKAEKAVDAKPAENNVPPRRAMVDYHERFQTQISNADGAMPCRLILASFLVEREGAKKMPLDLARDIMELYLAALEKDAVVTDSQQKNFIEVMNSIRGEEACKELVDRWGELFAKRYLHLGASNAKNRKRVDVIQNNEVLCMALYSYLAADDMERGHMLLNKYKGSLEGESSVLACLIRFGKMDLAAQRFRMHMMKFRDQWSLNDLLHYDDEIRKNAEEFFGKLNKEDERYAAEVLLATMPDIPEDIVCPMLLLRQIRARVYTFQKEPETLPKPTARDKRLIALAERLKEVQFSNKMLKTKVISGLLCSQQVDAILADAIAEEFQHLNYSKKSAEVDGMELNQKIAVAHIRISLQADNIQPLVETLQNLSTLPKNRWFLLQQFEVSILSECGKHLKKKDVSWTIEQSKQLAPALLTLVKYGNVNLLQNDPNAVSLLLVTHLHAGQAEELFEWCKGTEHGLSNQTCRIDGTFPMWQIIQKRIGKASAENLPQRTDMVRDVLRLALKLHCFVWQLQERNRMSGDSVPIFQRVTESGLMTREELVEHGPAMVEKLDDGGLAKAALAAWMEENQEPDKAMALWKDAIAAVPDKTLPQANYWRWDDARLLYRQGKKDEANAVAAEIDEKTLFEKHQGSFIRFRTAIAPANAK